MHADKYADAYSIDTVLVGDKQIGVVRQDWRMPGSRPLSTQYMAHVLDGRGGATIAGFDTAAKALDFWADHMERRAGTDGETRCGDILTTRGGTLSRRLCGDCGRAVDRDGRTELAQEMGCGEVLERVER